jgi:hypothetical protein
MAPERFLGEPVDHRADIYALACVLFQTLAGRAPYVGELPALMHGHMHLPVPSLAPLRPDLGARLDPVIARGMAKRPADRHATAGAFADAARAALHAAPPQPPQPLPHPHPPQPPQPQPAVARSVPLTPPPRPQPAFVAAGRPAPPTPPPRSPGGRGPLVAVAALAVLAVVAVIAVVALAAPSAGGGSSAAGSSASTRPGPTSTGPNGPAGPNGLTGSYVIEQGLSPGATAGYRGSVTVDVAADDVHRLSWTFPDGSAHTGVGFIEDATLAVAFANAGVPHGVVVYRIDGGTLTGRWVNAAPGSRPGRETLSGPAGLTGSYTVDGATSDGSPYTGTVTITRDGDRYDVAWAVSTGQYTGVGLRAGDLLIVGYANAGSTAGAVDYRIDGSALVGRWIRPGAVTAGTEVLRRQ